MIQTTNPLIETITSADPSRRDRSVKAEIAGLTIEQLLACCDELDAFRRGAENLYERVRAAMFLHAIYRYEVQYAPGITSSGTIPFAGVEALNERRFEQAVSSFLSAMRSQGPNGAVGSAVAQAYERIAYQTLADQVRRSVRNCKGSRWMFRVGAAEELPLKIHPRLLDRGDQALFPILIERTPVRLDLSHSAWSDIFFLGMDYPEGARVLNISVDLGVHGRDAEPKPPIETYCRVIAEPILRLTSIDLNACKDVATLEELFNFGNDYLGLVKAGVIASGLIPPSFEGTGIPLRAILDRVVRPGFGLEVVSKVNDIPKGSRLAVSTNLLASLIGLLMRATGQARNLTGPLDPDEARVVVSRAILGEWLGGSGGGWQDSGGVFPGVKIIRGVAAERGDPEWGVSRGRLLPEHEVIGSGGSDSRFEIPDSSNAPGGVIGERAGQEQARRVPSPPKSGIADPESPTPSPPLDEALARSLVLVHGGMAQNVGPILNMVTEKYLLRGEVEWAARNEALEVFEGIVSAVRAADVREIGRLTTRNWEGPLKTIIPWVSNAFTEAIIAEAKHALGEDFWGFLMLGGMSGGGMGFFVAPHRRDAFRDELKAIMRGVKARLDDALPFAMEPVVYDFRINPRGTVAELIEGAAASMPPRYYALQVGSMIAGGTHQVELRRKADIDHFANGSADTQELLRVFRTMINGLFPVAHSANDASTTWDDQSEAIRRENGFDALQHAQLRDDLQRGRIGLARNRLPIATDIRDVEDSDLVAASGSIQSACSAYRRETRRGRPASRRGGRRHPGRRGRQPLDHRGGRGQGREPVRRTRRQAPQLPRNPPRQDPLHPGALRDEDSPRRHDELPDPRGHRAPPEPDQKLWARRTRRPVSWPVDRPEARPDGPRPDVPVGGAGPRDPRREQAEGPRGLPPRDPRLGPFPRRGARLHRQRPDPALQPSRPFLRGPDPPAQRRPRATDRRAPELEIPPGPQHRHPRREPRPRRLRSRDRVRLRGALASRSSPDGSRIAAAAWRASAASCGCWRASPSLAKTSNSASAITTR